VGLVELTGMARSILAQPQFLGRYAEVYLFIGLIYWLFCYSMSLAAKKLEKQLNN
jgi:general L-amino acid transport system permease protein